MRDQSLGCITHTGKWGIFMACCLVGLDMKIIKLENIALRLVMHLQWEKFPTFQSIITLHVDHSWPGKNHQLYWVATSLLVDEIRASVIYGFVNGQQQTWQQLLPKFIQMRKWIEYKEPIPLSLISTKLRKLPFWNFQFCSKKNH